MERSGESAVILEQLHPHLDHEWRAMLRRGARPRLPNPAADAPAHVRMAFYTEQLDVAFRRGYLARPASLTAPAASLPDAQPGVG